MHRLAADFFIGIDPGTHTGVVALDKKGREGHAKEILYEDVVQLKAKLLCGLPVHGDVLIENQFGATATFRGAIATVEMAVRIDTILRLDNTAHPWDMFVIDWVYPVSWRKEAGISQKGERGHGKTRALLKKAAKERAVELMPDLLKEVRRNHPRVRVLSDNVAEAGLMAWVCWQRGMKGQGGEHTN